MNKEERVLGALSDLTNGALNYYQAPQTVMVRENLIREYIEDLQQQNEDLRKQITEYQDEIFARDNNWCDMQD